MIVTLHRYGAAVRWQQTMYLTRASLRIIKWIVRHAAAYRCTYTLSFFAQPIPSPVYVGGDGQFIFPQVACQGIALIELTVTWWHNLHVFNWHDWEQTHRTYSRIFSRNEIWPKHFLWSYIQHGLKRYAKTSVFGPIWWSRIEIFVEIVGGKLWPALCLSTQTSSDF